MSDERLEQRLAVPYGFPVVFTDRIFAVENGVLPGILRAENVERARRIALYIDAGVNADGLAESAAKTFAMWNLPLAAAPKVLPAGEAVKNDWAATLGLIEEMLRLRLDRHAYIVIVGGGALLDAVGFAASLVHRGLRVIRVPSTALAQCDGGVGVKTAVNFAGGKNAVGTFAPPFAVINDFQFLLTLPAREWRAGIAEAFKVAIIRDAEFFDFLCGNTGAFMNREEAAMRRLVYRCAELHLEHIRTGGDPFEMGRARPLDFAHWSAHKLELLSDFRVSHGDAVAAGIALDSAYAMREGWIGRDEFDRIYKALRECGFALWYEEMDSALLLDGLREFQEHLGGELCVTFPNGIGDRREESRVTVDGVHASLNLLKGLTALNPA